MPRSQAERLWITGGALVALVMLAVGYLFFIAPQRSHTSDVNDKVDGAQMQNFALQQRIDTLRRQSKNIDRYRTALHQAELALPTTSGLPAFLRSLQSTGSATRTEVSSITIGAPTAVKAPAPTSTTAASAAPSAAPSPAAAPAVGAGVFAIPISAQVTGSTSALLRFLTQLQSVQPRAVLVTQVSLADAATGGANSPSTLSITMQAFTNPAAAPGPAQPSSAPQQP